MTNSSRAGDDLPEAGEADADVSRGAFRDYGLAALGFAVCLAGTLLAFALSERDGHRSAGEMFQREWDRRLAEARAEVGNTFSLTYDAIRTMAMLPGVQRIDRYAKGFEGDPRLTVQPLYNDIASHVAVSEIYIVPADLEPDRLDPVNALPIQVTR